MTPRRRLATLGAVNCSPYDRLIFGHSHSKPRLSGVRFVREHLFPVLVWVVGTAVFLAGVWQLLLLIRNHGSHGRILGWVLGALLLLVVGLVVHIYQMAHTTVQVQSESRGGTSRVDLAQRCDEVAMKIREFDGRDLDGSELPKVVKKVTATPEGKRLMETIQSAAQFAPTKTTVIHEPGARDVEIAKTFGEKNGETVRRLFGDLTEAGEVSESEYKLFHDYRERDQLAEHLRITARRLRAQKTFRHHSLGHPFRGDSARV
jgi:hypothetical protein